MVQRKSKRKQAIAKKEEVAGTTVQTGASKIKDVMARLPPEILSLIGGVISGVVTLRALVGTCRTFRDVFEPFLYASRIYSLHKLNPVRPRYISLPPGLVHTKELAMTLLEFVEGFKKQGVKYDPKTMNDNYARYLARLIKELPNMQSFRWHDQACENLDTAQIMRNKTLLKALKAAPKLRQISICFESVFNEDDPRSLSCSISLTGFTNLTSLSVYNIFGRQVDLIKDLASVLSRCPGMRSLGIGIACHAEWDVFPESMIIPGERDFLEKLCLSYHTLSDGPLSLETLRLGWGLCILKAKSPEVGNYLDLLFKPVDLRTLHVFNGYVRLGDEDTLTQHMPVEWGLLDKCTSIHQVAINRLNDGVKDWLNSTAQNVKEIILSDRDGMRYGFAQARMPLLDHSLTLLFAAEDGFRRLYHENLDSDSNSSLFSSSESLDVQSSPPPNTDNHSTISTEMAAGGLSGSGKWLPPSDERVATVLDRLKDGGRHLTQLGLSLDLDVQWEHFAKRLRTLHYLTHLRVMRRTWKYGPWPNKECSLWPGVSNAKQVALRYAQLIKVLCPSIQFVRFHDWTWQFVLQCDMSKVIKGDVNSKYVMLELEWIETSMSPIFAKDPVNSQAGLPYDDVDGPSETNWEEGDEFRKMYEAHVEQWRSIQDAGDEDAYV